MELALLVSILATLWMLGAAALAVNEDCPPTKYIEQGELKGLLVLDPTAILSPKDKRKCINACVYLHQIDRNQYCFQKVPQVEIPLKSTTWFVDATTEDSTTLAVFPVNQLYCNLNRDHTMCKYAQQSANCASRTIYRTINDDFRTAILNRHNVLRGKVARGEERAQAQAANMKKLVWSLELERIAQRWADQCSQGSEHDALREKLDGTTVGQSVFHVSSTTRTNDHESAMAELLGGLEVWYNQRKSIGFNPGHIKEFWRHSGIEEYSQLIWAETEEIGCGMVYWQADDGYDNILICNYAKGGNQKGRYIYTIGKPCSSCPAEFSDCETGLCARPKPPPKQMKQALFLP